MPQRSESARLLRIALPLTAANVAEMAMIITDMLIVGPLGSEAVAAVGLAGDLFWIFLLIGMGCLSLVGVFAAQALGAGDRQGVIAAAEQGMVAAAITALPLMLLVAALGPLLALANQDGQVVSLIGDYSLMLLWAVPPALWFATLRNYSTALGAPGAIGWITAGAVLLNAVLNYALVYGALGLPALGVAGAGLGTALVNWVMFFTLGGVLRGNPRLSEHRPRWWPERLDRTLLSSLFRLGAPAALNQVVYGGVFSAAAIAVGAISATALAAQQMLYSLIYLAVSAAWGLADGARVRVAYGVGRGDIAICRRATAQSLRLAAWTLLPAAFLLWLAPAQLVALFLDKTSPDAADVLAIVGPLGGLAALFLIVDGAQVILASVLRGLRDTRSPLYASLIGYWVTGFAPGLWLAFVLNLGALGIWIGLLTGVLIATGLLYLAYRHRLYVVGREIALSREGGSASD